MQLMDLRFSDLQTQLAMWKQPKFRAQQIWKWVYQHLATDFQDMTSLPKSLRQVLAQCYSLEPLEAIDDLVSRDGLTRKVLFRLQDGETIESVWMVYDQRRTVCVSSQVGCAIGCAFCATGQSGFVRHLSAGEIVAQPLYFARQQHERGRDQPLTNIVVMGMGEPMLNYDAVWQAVETWNDPLAMNLGARRITLSTAGHVPGIRRLSQEHIQVRLAVSLHAAEDDLRDQLVPLNRRYPLSDLLSACREYIDCTGRRVTFEYALMDGVNDTVAQAQRLAERLRGILCHVNLIPINPTPGGAYRPSPRERVRAFQQVLQEHRLPVTVRLRRGLDIRAGCGQLRQQSIHS